MEDKISVIIITRNEERDIAACLESVWGWANEIIVVDSGSTDRTVALCREKGARVFTREWTGYGPQKEHALSLATGNWVLNIDADERVSSGLQEEISKVIMDKPDFSGYRVPFHTFFRGKRLRFGKGAKETHIRFFKRQDSSYGNAPVHEGITVSGKIGDLRQPILHYSYATIEDYLNKCNTYTSLIAQKKHKEGARFHFFHHFRLFWEFLDRYVIRLGFLDGREGFIYAFLSSVYVWLKYVKLSDVEKGDL